MDWTTKIGVEGGPVLIANADDFLAWTGSIPFPLGAHRELLFYSPFTAGLPERFLVQGDTGHLRFECDDPAALRDELVSACLERFPGSTVRRSEESWVLTRPDGKKLHASLEPSSEYALATRDLVDDGVHEYGGGRRCYLWSVEPGLVSVTVRRGHSELLMSQLHYADGGDDAADAYAHAATHPPSNDSGVTYEVTTGPVVAVWSPQAATDLQRPGDLERPREDAPGRVLDLTTDASGAAVWLRPGRYRARTARREGGSWAVSWCLLSRTCG